MKQFHFAHSQSVFVSLILGVCHAGPYVRYFESHIFLNPNDFYSRVAYPKCLQMKDVVLTAMRFMHMKIRLLIKFASLKLWLYFL